MASDCCPRCVRVAFETHRMTFNGAQSISNHQKVTRKRTKGPDEPRRLVRESARAPEAHIPILADREVRLGEIRSAHDDVVVRHNRLRQPPHYAAVFR